MTRLVIFSEIALHSPKFITVVLNCGDKLTQNFRKTVYIEYGCLSLLIQ